MTVWQHKEGLGKAVQGEAGAGLGKAQARAAGSAAELKQHRGWQCCSTQVTVGDGWWCEWAGGYQL